MLTAATGQRRRAHRSPLSWLAFVPLFLAIFLMAQIWMGLRLSSGHSQSAAKERQVATLRVTSHACRLCDSWRSDVCILWHSHLLGIRERGPEAQSFRSRAEACECATGALGSMVPQAQRKSPAFFHAWCRAAREEWAVCHTHSHVVATQYTMMQHAATPWDDRLRYVLGIEANPDAEWRRLTAVRAGSTDALLHAHSLARAHMRARMSTYAHASHACARSPTQALCKTGCAHACVRAQVA
jgi:hypothetical protein